MSLWRLTIAEFLKLRRTLVLLLVLGIPLVVLVLLVTILLSGNGPDDWQRLAMTGSAIWAYFLLPMTTTAFTALQAQVEYAPGAWSHALTSRHGPTRIFLAKAAVTVLAMAVLTVLIGLAIVAGGQLALVLGLEGGLAGAVPLSLLADLLGRMWLAGLLLMAIQFGVAMGFSSFAVPIVVGIAGTFIATVATSARAGIYFPWLLPTNILASDPARADQALLTGSIAGLLLLLLVCFWLGRRDWH